jgi:hypothetical protein
MNETKPVYCIRSRGARVEKEGSFAEIVAWLEERRIRSDDDLRRLGFSVLEKDELWAQVRDFPEFKLTERQGRQGLSRAKVRAFWAMSLGVVLAAIGSTLIVYDQLIPRYTEKSRVAEAQAQVEVARASEAAAIRRQKEARDERDAMKRTLEVQQASLNSAIARSDNLQDQLKALSQRQLDQEKVYKGTFNALNSQLRDQGESFKGTESQWQGLIGELRKEKEGLKSQLASAKSDSEEKASLAVHWMDRALASEKNLESTREEAVRVRDYWKSLYETERKKSKMEKLFGD